MPQLDELILQKQVLLNSNKPVRARNAAEQLGISEAQYVALSLGDGAEELDMHCMKDLFDQLASCGELMALTRNNEVVMERKGIYQNPHAVNDALILMNKDINLRLRVMAWRYGFAVNENGRQSLQFFGADAMAAHKIYATDLTHKRIFQALINRFKLPKPQPRLLEIVCLDQPKTTSPKEINADAQQVHNGAVKQLFTQIAENQLPIMLLIANKDASQIFTGRIHKLLETGPWFNVLDPGFDLHMNMNGIHQAWWVRKQLKPTNNQEPAQTSHSVEFFNAQGEVVLVVNLEKNAKNNTNLDSRWQNCLQSLVAPIANE
jgi:putative hemin transport protein